MPPRKLTDEQLSNLKFEDCRVCRFALTKKCRGCGYGEKFEAADEPEDTFEFMGRFG